MTTPGSTNEDFPPPSRSVSACEDASKSIVRRTTSSRLVNLKTCFPAKRGLEPKSFMGKVGQCAQGWLQCQVTKLNMKFPMFQRQMSMFAEKFPMVVAGLEFLVYGVDLMFRTMQWFRFGYMAVWLGFRLFVYAFLLLPAFLQAAAAYFHDARILRRIRYGPEWRNYVDVYQPAEAVAAQEGKGPKVPVVIAVMGGAWIMGHRGWNAQLGRRFMDCGVLVFAVDYRNFPFGCVPDMVEDIGRAVGWIFENAEAYGGDASNMMLLAQSAGAHISALLLLEHSLLEANAAEGKNRMATSPSRVRFSTQGGNTPRQDDSPPTEPDSPPVHLGGWSTKNLKAFLGVSGVYDLVALEPHLVSRGIYSRILYALSIDGDLAGCSPTQVLSAPDWWAAKASAAALLPPVYLLHGGADKSVPPYSSIDFAEGLRGVGFGSLTVDVRPGMTHTWPVIEGPMAGEDPQVELALPFLVGMEKAKELIAGSPRPRMWPQTLIDVAGPIMPF